LEVSYTSAGIGTAEKGGHEAEAEAAEIDQLESLATKAERSTGSNQGDQKSTGALAGGVAQVSTLTLPVLRDEFKFEGSLGESWPLLVTSG